MGIEKTLSGKNLSAAEVTAIQKQLAERVAAGYNPTYSFESAEDHWIPFDNLTEKQFYAGVKMGRAMRNYTMH